MTIKKTLLIAFLAMTLLILSLLSLSIYTSYNSKTTTIQLIHDHEVSRSMANVSVTAQKIRRFETEYLLYFGEDKSQEMLNGWNKHSEIILAEFNMLEQNLAACGQAALVPLVLEWKDAFNAYRTQFNQVNEAINNANITTAAQAQDSLKMGHEYFQVLLDGASKAIEDMFSSAQEGGDQARISLNLFLTITAIISILSAVIAVVATIIIPKLISTPINKLSEIATLISKGKANTVIEIGGSPEIVELSKSMDRLRISTVGIFDRYQKQKNKYDELKNKIIEAKKRKEITRQNELES